MLKQCCIVDIYKNVILETLRLKWKERITIRLQISLGRQNHIGATIEADIVKQKLPTLNGGYVALNKGGVKYGKMDDSAYTELSSDHPIDLTRYQVANCYMG